MLGHEMSHFSQLVNVRCHIFPRDPNVKTLRLQCPTNSNLGHIYYLSFSMLKVILKDKNHQPHNSAGGATKENVH